VHAGEHNLTEVPALPAVDVNAIADYLGFSPIFAPLSQKERLDLSSRMRMRRYARNEVVFHRDDPATHCFLIASGTVKVSAQEEGGQEVVIALMRGGEIVGELALFDSEPRSATVTAITETIAFALSAKDFNDMLQHNPAAMQQLLVVLARRIRQSTGHIEDLVFLDLPGRVAKSLLDQNELGGTTGTVQLTQEEIASFVGATRVAVNRVLVDLERRGALRLGRGHVEIADVDLLKKEIRR
jgi:CRP/FNR family cyclic AMP-dependent transcriptional regulator